jgi:hypothetical protein
MRMFEVWSKSGRGYFTLRKMNLKEGKEATEEEVQSYLHRTLRYEV